jgi:hypothetical protein
MTKGWAQRRWCLTSEVGSGDSNESMTCRHYECHTRHRKICEWMFWHDLETTRRLCACCHAEHSNDCSAEQQSIVVLVSSGQSWNSGQLKSWFVTWMAEKRFWTKDQRTQECSMPLLLRLKV